MRPGGRQSPSATLPARTPAEDAAIYKAVIDSALDAVIVVDEGGAVVAMNSAAEETFGYTLSEALGREIGDLIVPDELKEAHRQGMARYRATREPHVLGRRVEMNARCKDGRTIPVELAITEVQLSASRLFTANLRDLSAVKAAAAEIERQRDALHQSEKLAALGSLLAGVAHELNNPLSIVLGQATLLRQEVEDAGAAPSTAERAAKIEAAAERCARVVRSFLAIARQRNTEKRAVAIVPLLDASLELLLYGLRSSGILVTRDYDAAVPDVLADPDQVQQIVVNVLVNAKQALEEQEGAREITIRARAAGDGRVHIVIADNGPGVPQDKLGRIFDPFFTTKRHGVGTGIGLSISRSLAEAQGGQLLLLPRSLPGAAFELSLPRAAEAVQAEGATSKNAPGTPASASGKTARRAIVIDDEVEIAALIAEVLSRAGYRCDLATSGGEGQRIIADRAGHYDLVISDLRMQDVDGQALFRWLETNYPELAERTAFVTGDALGSAAGRFLAESNRPVLEKPFTAAEIARFVAGVRAH